MGGGNAVLDGGTAGAGKGLTSPRYGLLNGPAGLVTLICGLNGVTSTNRLFAMPACCESWKDPKAPRKLVLPSPKTSKAKPNRGAITAQDGLTPLAGNPASPGNRRPAGALGN